MTEQLATSIHDREGNYLLSKNQFKTVGFEDGSGGDLG